MSNDTVLVLVVITALAFDFTNGFHDTGNAMATSIATGALGPRTAVAISGVLNFVGAFLSLAVAATIASGLVATGAVTLTVVAAGLAGGIIWNLVTWLFGIPSSSSHALIGGVIGSTIAAAGGSAVLWHGLVSKVVLPGHPLPDHRRGRRGLRHLAVVPDHQVADRGGAQARLPDRAGRLGLRGLAGARHQRRAEDHGRHHPGADRQRHGGQGVQRAGLGHRLLRAGDLHRHLPRRLAGHPHLGKGLVEIESPQGMAAESASAAVILLSSTFGYSLSTTHVATGSIIGTGLGKKGADVRWSIAGRMATAWVFTLPSAAIVGAAGLRDRGRHRRHLRRHHRPDHPGRALRVHLLALPRHQGGPQQRERGMDRRGLPGEVPARLPRPEQRERRIGTMSWINLTALWKIIVFGLIAGAGLPALFAGGLYALSLGPKTGHGGAAGVDGDVDSDVVVGGSVVGMVLAAIAFLIMLAAIGWSVYEIYTLGHPAPKK